MSANGAHRQDVFTPAAAADPLRNASPGRCVVLAGSCSQASLEQVARAIEAGSPSLGLDPVAISEGRQTIEDVAAFVASAAPDSLPVVYSSAGREALERSQRALGRERAGTLVEDFLAGLALRLGRDGFTRFIVAGGETSGAVVTALGIAAMEIGPEIDVGVPWTTAQSGAETLALALKSGNFGSANFFHKAAGMLP